MNVHDQCAGPGPMGSLNSPIREPIYRSMSWGDMVHLRSLNPKCNPTKAAFTLAAAHPDSVFGQEVESRIGKTTTGEPTRNADQAIALRRLAVLEDHEVTIDALRDTGLPEDLAIDLVRRLLPRPTGWSIFERMSATPNLNAWARSVMTREAEVHVADDILTLRILQTFGHDVTVPWALDTTNRWLFFYSTTAYEPESLGQLLDIATLDRPNCYAMRNACRKGYQALAYCHYGAGGQIWPHWEVYGGRWQVHPDPRTGLNTGDIVSTNGITCDTERWLRDVTMVGGLDATGYSPRVGVDYESDLSDPENVACDPQRAPIAPSDLHERLETMTALRREARRAGLPPAAPHLDTSAASPDADR